MEYWIRFWEVLCLVSFIYFFFLILALIPLGTKDLLSLFKHLEETTDEPESE